VDTDEDMDEKAQPDFSPLDSALRRASDAKTTSNSSSLSKGLGVHASLREQAFSELRTSPNVTIEEDGI